MSVQLWSEVVRGYGFVVSIWVWAWRYGEACGGIGRGVGGCVDGGCFHG